jgi:FkbM family methyltransferase
MVAAARIENLKSYLYLATHFRNGVDLIRAYRNGPPCGSAVRWNGDRIIHPQNRDGLVGTILELWKDRCYTRDGFYRPQDGDYVVDAGAHVGLFSLSMALENPNCHVLALEPFQENYVCLRENLRVSKVTNVEALPMALGGGQWTAFMKPVGSRSIDHLLQSLPDDQSRPVQVVSLSGVLEHLGIDRVAMLKMDVEGAEHDAFEAADQEILSRFERIAMEYHDNLRPGTLDLIQRKLESTHDIRVEPTFDRGYGILFAKLRSLTSNI